MKRILWKTLLLLLLAVHMAPAATIHGFVKDKANKEPIVMANVWLKESKIGTMTNIKGYYVLSSLPSGTYDVCFRVLGYKMLVLTRTVKETEDLELWVDLEQEMIELEETVISAEREKREIEIKPSQITVQVPQLRRIPQVAEADLFRAVQMLPGVATLSDFSAGLYIRGGSPDQNLILLDQIDVYNPNHMFGFFSTFNTDAIKSVELLKGGFPASYGGRLSSVLNVVNKEGNRKEFQGVANLSLISASSTLEGPWKKGSWMVSGRRTYLEAASKLVGEDLPYYFYDAHAKFNYDINKNNLASISFYAGNDVLDLDQDGDAVHLDWGNKTFSSQWTHLFNSKLFSHFVFAGSQFASNAKVKFDKVEFGMHNSITDFSLKGMLTYAPSHRHSMDFGFETKDLDFGLEYKIVDSNYDNNFAGQYYTLYFQDNYKITDFNVLQTGVRAEYYSDGKYARIAPRLAVKHTLTDRMNFTLSYGRFHQYLNLVQQEGLSFADMWFPVDHTFDPGSADHFIAGFSYNDNSRFSFEAEAYYKKYANIAEYRTYREMDESFEDQTAAQNFLSGTGFAYGMDFYLRNKAGKLEGWVGYSLGWTKKKITDYNFGLEYFPTYDRRHTITAIQDYRLNKRWRINLAFKYGSGQPYTEATARYAVM